MDRVVDASVAVKCFVPEPHTAIAKDIMLQPGTMHAPELFRVEVVSVLCRKIQIGELRADEGREAVNVFLALEGMPSFSDSPPPDLTVLPLAVV